MLRKLAFAALLAGVVFISGCSDQATTYMEVTGGGFIFNYRIAEAFAGLVVIPHGTLPDRSVIEVTMENPAGGAPITMRREPSAPGRIGFTTGPLHGIVADKDYAVTVRLVSADGVELQRIEKKFRSQLDQSVLPAGPLTIGPGYARPPTPDQPGAAPSP